MVYSSHNIITYMLLWFLLGVPPVVLSPCGPGVALVCSGGQLELTCTTAGAFLEWDFHISENGTTTTRGRLVNSQAGVILKPIMTDSITFNFSRVSLPGSVPLVSKLVMITERSTLNGTEVMCVCIDIVTKLRSSNYCSYHERKFSTAGYVV